jgi:hypothetical protein
MAESVHDELLRISNELDRLHLEGAAAAMIRGARRINDLEKALQRTKELSLEAEYSMRCGLPVSAQKLLAEITEAASAALEYRPAQMKGREG